MWLDFRSNTPFIHNFKPFCCLKFILLLFRPHCKFLGRSFLFVVNIFTVFQSLWLCFRLSCHCVHYFQLRDAYFPFDGHCTNYFLLKVSLFAILPPFCPCFQRKLYKFPVNVAIFSIDYTFYP